MTAKKQTKLQKESITKQHSDLDNSISKDIPQSKETIVQRPKTSTAKQVYELSKRNVEMSAGSSSRSQGKSCGKVASLKNARAITRSRIAVTSAEVHPEQKYSTALNRTKANSNMVTSSKGPRDTEQKSSAHPFSASTRNTGDIKKVDSTTTTNSVNDLAKRTSSKYKTNTDGFNTTPKKQAKLQQATKKPPVAYKTARALPAPMPEPEFIEVRIPVDHWNKATWLRSGYWDYNERYETVRVNRGERIPKRKLLKSNWSFDKYEY